MKNKTEIAQEYLDFIVSKSEVGRSFNLTNKEQEIYDMALGHIRKALLPDVPRQRWYKRFFR